MIEKLTQLIIQQGKPWSKYLLFKEIIKLPSDDSIFVELKKQIINDSRIQEVYHRLLDPEFGVLSLTEKPASHRVYNSFYWGLRFLADIGLTKEDLPLDEIVEPIFIHQLADGKFTAWYHHRNKTPVATICLTANLAYSLARLGYQNHRSVVAALEYILTTQRKDGGWHCDWKKQRGEQEEDAMSCPIANIFVIRALATYGERYSSLLKNAIQQIYDYWEADDSFSCDFGNLFKTNKLRYPPHYWGFDILNILDTLSMLPNFCTNITCKAMLQQVTSKWDKKYFFKSEKSIPGWRKFDFGKNNNYSCWISCLIVRIFTQICVS